MWCLVDGTAGNAEVTSLNVLLGSWGVVPEVLEISKLGHYVAEHLVEPRRRSSRTEACVLLKLSSSIENSRDLDQHQRFGVACTRQASGMVHIVRKVTVQRSGSLGFRRLDSI